MAKSSHADDHPDLQSFDHRRATVAAVLGWKADANNPTLSKQERHDAALLYRGAMAAASILGDMLSERG